MSVDEIALEPRRPPFPEWVKHFDIPGMIRVVDVYTLTPCTDCEARCCGRFDPSINRTCLERAPVFACEVTIGFASASGSP